MITRRLISLPDCCTAGLGFAVAETSLMLFREYPGHYLFLAVAANGVRWLELRIARHEWNIPVCWLLGDTVKVGRSPVRTDELRPEAHRKSRLYLQVVTFWTVAGYHNGDIISQDIDLLVAT